MKKTSLCIHGGAGVITRGSLSPELEKEYRRGLEDAMTCGLKILSSGGNAIDAVEAAVVSLEDNPLFNAGKGSVLTHEGVCEMDAALMDGSTGKAGSVAGVTTIKNPVRLARLVMERSAHVMLAGKGAEEFARTNGAEEMPADYFLTELRKQQWEKMKNSDSVSLDHDGNKKFGTVGAVALDTNGNLAAATSTGGMTNKRWGRIGDSPVIGAGTFADHVVAISCTGHGEFFIRHVVAHEISALMRMRNMTLADAAGLLVDTVLKNAGGEGGLIAVDHDGNIALPFNTPGMYRAWTDASGNIRTGVYRES
ncbi:MAG TPA: isoaspartyl peptidase/L-asparaginase [Bacteroidia bacterium]|nr:isoaspartyl peptidase/L-asparaginase [Bacteroidia bacterium]